MTKLQVGDQAPDFNLPANNGQTVNLKDYRGKKNVIIYFYPKDDTPGCTVEACGFRDSIKMIEKQDTVVFGVNADSVGSHEKFIQKFKLPFLLLSDATKKMCQNYDVIAQKSMFGKKYLGIARTTFVVDKQGKIAQVFTNVKPQGHNDEILSFLKTL